MARVRQFGVKKLFKYNLVSSSYLFEGDGLMKSASKSLLVTELEKYLEDNDYTHPISSPMRTVYLIDIMSHVRKLDVKQKQTFGDFCKAFLSYVLGLCHDANEIHFVFDWYKEGTVKDSERSRRYQDMAIDINIMSTITPLPVNMSSFWVSNKNKEKLQYLLHNQIKDFSEQSCEVCIVLSATMVEDTIISCTKFNPSSMVPELNVEIEEADLRFFPHAKYAVENGGKRIVALGNDTDIIIGFIYHCQYLKDIGLKELWIRGGNAKTTRYIPIHILVIKLGAPICKQLSAMHCLTGHDANSKFGTKLSGLKQLPLAHLYNFGSDPRLNSVEEMHESAEKYLIQVLKHGSSCRNMDELRYYIYHHSKGHSFIDLPATTYETRGHSLRALINTHQYLYAMISECMPILDPREHGYEENDGLLIPSRY